MSTAHRTSVVHVLPAKMGGVVTSTAALLARFDRERFRHDAVLVHHTLSADTVFDGELPVEGQARFEHSLPLENLYSVIRRLARSIPSGSGFLVANDWLELATLCRYPTTRHVIQVLHGDSDYYLDLAQKHESVVDAFIACSREIFDALARRLPSRRQDIHHVPHGVELPSAPRSASNGPLRVLYAGRLENKQKGILDLPEIERDLKARGVTVQWTIVGGGPDDRRLRSAWQEVGEVEWVGVLDHERTIQRMLRNDVFVLPTRAEGLPVALLEAMACGLVPVVSRTSSGVSELVIPRRTGFLPEVGDIGAFSAAIATLDRDRKMLTKLSLQARGFVSERFPIERQVEWFERYFSDASRIAKVPGARRPLPYGSRLDKPWLPNPLVRFLRATSHLSNAVLR